MTAPSAIPGSGASTTPPDRTCYARVFRVRKYYRNVGIVCLFFFAAVGIASVWAILEGVPPERRPFAVWFALFLALFWSCWTGLSLWLLLAYCRESLELADGQVVTQGVFRRKQLLLDSVTDARWKHMKSGAIRLRTMTERLTINFDNFEPTERLWLIYVLRSRLPATVQRNWERFCLKVAIPLRDRDAPGNRLPGPDQVTLPRSRWDWYFIPAILLSAVIGSVAYWKYDQPRVLVAPLMPTLLWLLLRFGTPRQGLVVKRMGAAPGERRFLFFLLSWFCVAVVGMLLYQFFRPPMPYAAAVGVTGWIVWFGGLLFRATQFDRQRQQADLEGPRIATQQWDEGAERLAETLFGDDKSGC
jgi:hypothetical protein